MKAIWKVANLECDVLEKDGESIVLAVPAIGTIEGNEYSWLEKLQLDEADEYEITDDTPIIKLTPHNIVWKK